MEVVNRLIILVLSAVLAFIPGLIVGAYFNKEVSDIVGLIAGIGTAAIIFPKVTEVVKSFWKGL